MLALWIAGSRAAEPSPAGDWLVSDETSGMPQAIVTISLQPDGLHGRVSRILDAEDPDPRCGACAGPRHDQPVLGMEVLWGLQRDPADSWRWIGGHVLDPDEGRIYRAELVLADAGRQLELRAYVGTPWLGRTERWRRR